MRIVLLRMGNAGWNVDQAVRGHNRLLAPGDPFRPPGDDQQELREIILQLSNESRTMAAFKYDYATTGHRHDLGPNHSLMGLQSLRAIAGGREMRSFLSQWHHWHFAAHRA